MKTSYVETDSYDPKDVPSAILQQFILDCFLNHKIKLIRNWGSADDEDHLCYKDVTLLHFATRSCNFQMLIRPKENRIHIAHHSKRGRKLYLYFVKKLAAMITGDYKPNF